ncbi:MAG: type I-U CRISPR-associated RAMP protein Csb1/Cas7u [Candidatus Methylumidiphilus sp.]
MTLTYQTLRTAADDALAVSFLGHFQPSDANAPPYRVMPPTYAPAKSGDPPQYLLTASGEVRLDSPQSFANRLEEAIAAAQLTPSFTVVNGDGVPLANSRQLPHRVFDATLRDALLDGQPFFQSPLGAALRAARPANASALFRHAPEALLFGVWDSHSGGGIHALRLARAVTARVYGTGVQARPGGAQKTDPLNITKDAGAMYIDANGQMTLDPDAAAKGSKPKKPSDLGHGSVPASGIPDGVDVQAIILQGAIHLGVLRKYQFPAADGGLRPEADAAARAVLLALGIWAVQTVATRGMWLRSGCDLIDQDLVWRLRYGGGRDENLGVSTAAARAVLDEALAALAEDLRWQTAPVELAASKQLLKAIEKCSAALSVGETDE